MGGSKRKSPSQQEKSQNAEAEKKAGSKKSKKKDVKEHKAKSEISVILNEPEALKFIQNSKCFTVYQLAKDGGVKVSAANPFVKKALENGSVKKVGGYSGHYVYQTA